MIIDTDKINCCTCDCYKEYKTPEAVKEVLQNPGKLYACNGKYGFSIVGPQFFCAKHQLIKGR